MVNRVISVCNIRSQRRRQLLLPRLMVVFALSGSEVPKTDNLIRGTCFIKNVELIVIIYTGATHSFVSLECDKRFDLKLSFMVGNMVINTSTNGYVTTLMVYFSCLLTIYGKSFVTDLVCLPLH